MSNEKYNINISANQNIGLDQTDSYDIVLSVDTPHYVYGYGYGVSNYSFDLNSGDNPYDKTYPYELNYFNVLDIHGTAEGLAFQNTYSAPFNCQPDYVVGGISDPIAINGHYFQYGNNIYKNLNLTYILFLASDNYWYLYTSDDYDEFIDSGDTPSNYIASNTTGNDPTLLNYTVYGGSWTETSFIVRNSSSVDNMAYGWGYEQSDIIQGNFLDVVNIVATVYKNGSLLTASDDPVLVRFYGGSALSFEPDEVYTENSGIYLSKAITTVKVNPDKKMNLDNRIDKKYLVERPIFGFVDIIASVDISSTTFDGKYTIPTVSNSIYGDNISFVLNIDTQSYSYSYGIPF